MVCGFRVGRSRQAVRWRYAPWARAVELTEAMVAGVRVDYVQGGAGKPRGDAAVRRAHRLAKEAAKTPETVVRIRQFGLVGSELGFANETTTPHYRVFVADAQVHVSNLASPRAKDMAVATLSGRFMGSGATTIQARFRAAAPKTDFQADVKIENTDLQAMNDLVKPLFRDVKVYDTDTGTLAAVLRLIQNAFFSAILPGFDHQVPRTSRS